jgi:hypothetical protein
MVLQNWNLFSFHSSTLKNSFYSFQLEELKSKERENSSMRKQIIENESQVSSFIKHKTHTHIRWRSYGTGKNRRLLISFMLFKKEKFQFTLRHTLNLLSRGHSLFMCMHSKKKLCLKKFERALFLSFSHTSCTAKRASERPVSVSRKKKNIRASCWISVVHLR